MAIDVKLKLTDDATRTYNQFVGNIQKQAASMESAIKGVGTAIGAAFSIVAVKSFMDSAAQAQAGIAALQVALNNAGATSAEAKQAFLDQADALKKKTAIDDDEIIRVQALTVGMTGNARAAYQLTPAILDLAAGMGISTEAAAKMFSKSLEGSEGLKKAGISIGDTANETDRLGAIAAAVEKKWGGMAAQFAQTDAGKMKAMALAMEDLQKAVGTLINNAILPAMPALTRFVTFIGESMPKYIAVASGTLARVFQLLIAPFGALQETLAKFGINTGHALHNLFYDLQMVREQGLKAAESLGTTGEGIASIGGNAGGAANSVTLMKDQIKALQSELDKLNPGTKEYEAVLKKLTAAQQKYDDAVDFSKAHVLQNDDALSAYARTLEEKVKPALDKVSLKYKAFAVDLSKIDKAVAITTDHLTEENNRWVDSYKRSMSVWGDSVGQTLQTVLVDNLRTILGNQNSLLEMFLANLGEKLFAWGAEQLAAAITNALIAQTTSTATIAATTGEMAALTAAAAPAALAVNIASFGAAGAAAALSAASAGAAQASAMAAVSAVSKFHEGGTVGSYGQRLPLAPDERPAILRVGETVRTKEQEAALGNKGVTINVNINGSIADETSFVNVLKKAMRKAGVANIQDLIVNNRSNIALGTA